jgi:hypothetical protein
MGPLDGHFFSDLVSRRLLLETAVPVVGWIERCKFPGADQQGAWLAGDAIAPTLREVLGVMGRDSVPVILDVVRAFESWADSRPADLEQPPRGVAPCKTLLRGAVVERGAGPYTLWMLQRSIDAHRVLGDEERRQVEAAVAGTGWEEVLAYEPRHRLAKRGFDLVFE